MKCPMIVKLAEVGKGQGVGGPRQMDLGVDECKCPKCGNVIKHPKGTPCTTIECPKCGAKMAGKA